METTSIYSRGTEILKTENEFWTPNNNLGEEFEEDFIYVSRGFAHAVDNGLVPVEFHTEEWHHIFAKQEDGSFTARKIFFN